MADEQSISDEQYAELQRGFGGQVVARRGIDVIASSETLDGLIEKLLPIAQNWDDLIVEYVEPVDRVCVY